MALTEKIRRARAGSNDSSIKRAHPAAISASRTGSAKRCARAVGSMRPAVRTKSGSADHVAQPPERVADRRLANLKCRGRARRARYEQRVEPSTTKLHIVQDDFGGPIRNLHRLG